MEICMSAPFFFFLTLTDSLAKVWKTHWTPVKVAYLFCRQVARRLRVSHTHIAHGVRYWVIAVVPYLLYCFVMDHSLETCQTIYKARSTAKSLFSTYH
jgi:hypothetical protein